MTSSTSTVTKTVVTRSWRDIDPKVAIAALLTAIAHLVLVVLFLSGKITLTELAIGTGPSSVAVLGAYVKRSTHLDVPAAAVGVVELVHDLAPIVKQAAPETAPIVDEVVDGVDAIQAQLSEPIPAAEHVPSVGA